MSRAALAAALATCACGPAPGPASCADPLGGVYVTPAGARWMVLDNRPAPATLELYPLFPDAVDALAPPGVVVAPRVIDLRPTGAGLAGEVARRYARGGDHCDAHAPAHVTACAADGLEVILGEPVPPLAFAPCTPAAPAPSRRERWKRE